MTPNECAWVQDGDADCDLWATDCRNYFRIDDGTPTDNKMRYCCYCGKPLRTVPFEEMTP